MLPYGCAVGMLSAPGFADPRVSDEAVPSVVAIEAAGLANNVNYSEAAIMASIARLDEVGVAHTDAGANWAFACAPAILSGTGCASALVQHSSVYWPKVLSVGTHSRNS